MARALCLAGFLLLCGGFGCLVPASSAENDDITDAMAAPYDEDTLAVSSWSPTEAENLTSIRLLAQTVFAECDCINTDLLQTRKRILDVMTIMSLLPIILFTVLIVLAGCTHNRAEKKISKPASPGVPNP